MPQRRSAAWAELTALLDAPLAAATIQARIGPFWAMMREHQRERQVDVAWWSAAQAAVLARARAALLAGQPPAGPVAQAIARDWAAAYALAYALATLLVGL